MRSCLEVLRKYAEFDGRASRREYWTFIAVTLAITVGIGVLEYVAGLDGRYATMYWIATFIPSVAVTVRRLHDVGRSSTWLLLGLIPILGWLALIAFFIVDGQLGQNRYGENPKPAHALAQVASP